MYICICNAVSEDRLRAAYASTGCWKKAAQECGAGQNCGSCLDDVEACLSSRIENEQAPVPALAA